MWHDLIVRGALRPLAGPPLTLVAVTTVLFALAVAAGLIGLPLLLLALSWVWTYAFLLVNAVAHGLPLPVLSVEAANPWHEPRPLLQLLLLAGVASLAGFLGAHLGAWAAIGVGAFALLTLPASLALLAVEGSTARAVWPPALLRVALGLGAHYVLLLALGALYCAVLAAATPRLPPAALFALAQFFLYSLATTLGSALYARRHELGLEAWQAPERDREREQRSADRERAALADAIYGLLRARRPADAWARASAWLEQHGRDPTDLRWLHSRALEWGEARFADRIGDDLVARLVALGRRGEALAEVEACWARGGDVNLPDFRDRDALEAAAREARRDATLARLSAERAARAQGN
jgi:hypothetical protein